MRLQISGWRDDTCFVSASHASCVRSVPHCDATCSLMLQRAEVGRLRQRPSPFLSQCHIKMVILRSNNLHNVSITLVLFLIIPVRLTIFTFLPFHETRTEAMWCTDEGLLKRNELHLTQCFYDISPIQDLFFLFDMMQYDCSLIVVIWWVVFLILVLLLCIFLYPFWEEAHCVSISTVKSIDTFSKLSRITD